MGQHDDSYIPSGDADPDVPDETAYLMGSPAMRERLLRGLDEAKRSTAPIDYVNEAGRPLEMESASGATAWLVPDRLWKQLQDVAAGLVTDRGDTE